MYKVLVLEKLCDKGILLLQQHFHVDVMLKMPLEQLKKCIGDYEIIIVRSETQVSKELISLGTKLMVIARAGMGLDNIDIIEAQKRGIYVINAPKANTISAAEHTMGMIMAVARLIPQAHSSLKNRLWERDKFMGTELYGKTLGIIGLGSIGAEVAKRAHAFEMELIGYDPFCSIERADGLAVPLVEFNELLARSDFITIHVPKIKETINLIDFPQLMMCKKGVRIINVSRGGILNEEALISAIRLEHVAGAALDVFDEEPLSNFELLELNQIIVTPHIGASTDDAQIHVAKDILGSILQILFKETEV